MELEGFTGLAVYLTLKVGGYVLWCLFGIRWLGPPRQAALGRGIALGLLRVGVGWIAGLLIAPLVIVVGADHIPIFYFTALAFVRWFEWGLIAVLLPTNWAEKSRPAFLIGGSRRHVMWRLGGIAVSYLADAPFLIWGGGFPKGRFLC